MSLMKLNASCVHHYLRRQCSSIYSNVPVFKSKYSLDNIYAHKEVADSEDNKQSPISSTSFTGHIPVDKLNISYSRSSGPGGQHVNTTNTKVTIKLHLESADWINNETKLKLAKLHKNNINKEGYWIIRSDKTRVQTLNVADCMDKLRCFVTEASRPLKMPSDETLEMMRERKEKAAADRMKNKRVRSLTKQSRHSQD